MMYVDEIDMKSKFSPNVPRSRCGVVVRNQVGTDLVNVAHFPPKKHMLWYILKKIVRCDIFLPDSKSLLFHSVD